LGTLGYQAISKDVYPLFKADNEMYLATQLKNVGRFEPAYKLLQLADRDDRYKGLTRWYSLQMLVLSERYPETLKLFDSSAHEGLGMDAYYWKGRAHQLLNQPQEALAAYDQMVHYYTPDNDMRKRAESHIHELRDGASAPASPAAR
jgi:tetratricopeptide (TPR) repeat protein